MLYSLLAPTYYQRNAVDFLVLVVCFVLTARKYVKVVRKAASES